MGNTEGKKIKNIEFENPTSIKNRPNQIFNLKNLTKVGVIGRGGFGKVWRVESKKDRKLYALKQMSKARVLLKKSVQSVMNELNLLKCLKNDFLINAFYAFQDRQNLFLLMDLASGGDLRFHLIKMGFFNEQQSKFFTCCILLALQFLHNKGVIHRDLKPQNLVFDRNGYLHLTDLGVARIWKPQNAIDTSGTPGYMAPEVMCRSNHGVAADYFALGVIMHECMLGFRPYLGGSRQEIRDKVIAKQASIKKKDCPVGWSLLAVDFINQLLQRKPHQRLGYEGPHQLFDHPWLKNVNWGDMRAKRSCVPYIPSYNPDQYQDQINNYPEQPLLAETLVLLKKQPIQNLFLQYTYDGNQSLQPLLI